MPTSNERAPARALTDAEYAGQVTRVRAYFDQWLPITGLDRYAVHLVMCRDGEWDGNELSLFTCAWRWPYQLATLKCNLPLCSRRSDEEVERAVVHELAHAWTQELDDSRKASDYADHDEHVTTLIARALQRARGSRDSS